MYRAKAGIKKDHQRRWALPDRIFFGHGACHILAGVFLGEEPLSGFYAERIVPHQDLPGGHMYVTDGVVAFDYHGYSLRQRLLAHHGRVWRTWHPDWTCQVESVDFPILGAHALNARKMLGPGQYLHNPIPRASAFLARINHIEASGKARSLA